MGQASQHRPRFKIRISPFATVVSLLVLLIAGVVVWLVVAGEEEAPSRVAVSEPVVLELAPPVVESDRAAEETEEISAGESAPEPALAGRATLPGSETPSGQGASDVASPRPESGEFALAAAPDPALVEETPNGLLPVRGPGGRQAWRAYARPFDTVDPRPRIAIVLIGLGLNQGATNDAIQLPGAVTLSFTPYASSLPNWVSLARAAGHEVMIDLPMEPMNYPTDDPGPHTLLTSLNPSDNIARLEWVLGRFTGYVGVVDHMGSKFASSTEALHPVLGALKERGLMILDSRTSSDSVVFELAQEMVLPSAVSDGFVDKVASRDPIDRRLAELERKARETGSAVGVGRAYPVTIERLAAWLADLEARDFALAPVTGVVASQPTP